MEPAVAADGLNAPQGAPAPAPALPAPTNHVASSAVAPAAGTTAAAAPSQPASAAQAAAAPVPSPVPTPPVAGGGTPGGETPGSANKPRAQKTPYQKEALEAAYKLNSLPTEEMRRVLGERIGLSEAQVSTWFSHRRRKERKEAEATAAASTPATASAAASSPAAAGAAAPAAPALAPAGSAPPAAAPPAGATTAAKPAAASSGPPATAPALAVQHAQHADESEYYSDDDDREEDGEPDFAELQRLEEIRELLEVAKGTLEVPFREDGPLLAFEFDDIPLLPGSGGVPHKKAAGAKRQRGEEDPDFEFGSKKARPAPRPKLMVSSSDLGRLRQEEEARALLLAEKARLTQERLEAAIKREQERLGREKERVDVRVAKEREREILRLEAERKKHLEKVLRDQKKEEERKLKEVARLRLLQEKEQRKLMAQLEKEKKAEERKRQLEEKKKEKEMLKALQQQERNAMRMRARSAAEAGPKDDADWEWEMLMAEYRARHGLPAEQPLPAEGSPPPEGLPPLPARPPFPPPSVRLERAFPPEIGDAEAGELLSAWTFLSSFGGLVGLRPCSLGALLEAVAVGAPSALLGQLHIGLLRLLQADAEEAHAAGTLQTHGGDPAQAAAATLLEEAWAWGFDVDAWRAHLNALTWPEVAREVAIAAGLGRKRPKPRKEEKPKLGQEGEDIVVDESGALKLKLPPRLQAGSVKAAAWQVLAEAGPQGMRVEEIARRIQKLGLRDLRSSRTPEASVAGALGRDVLFTRVAPATYALQAIIAYQSKLQQGAVGAAAAAGTEVKAEGEGATAASGEVKAEGGEVAAGVKQEPAVKQEQGGAEGGPEGEAAQQGQQGQQAARQQSGAGKIEVVRSEPGQEGAGGEDHEQEESESEDGDEEERQEEEDEGAPWIRALECSEYDALPLALRISMLASFCDLATAGPTVRDLLERRLEEQQRVKRQMLEDNKAEKRRKQVEAAAKAKAAAEEAQRALEKYRAAAEGAGAGTAAENTAAPQPPAGEGEAAEAGGDPAAPAAAAAPTAAPAAPAGAPSPPPAGPDSPPAPAVEPQQAQQGASTPTLAVAPAGGAGDGGGTPVDPHSAAQMAIAAAEKQLVKTGETEEEKAAAKARQAARAEAVRRDLEANSVRMEPLGLDRRHNKYWRFVLPNSSGGSGGAAAGAGDGDNDKGAKQEGAGGGEQLMDVDGAREGEQQSQEGQGTSGGAVDPCEGRLFFESAEDGSLKVLRDVEDLEALMGALERRGAREGGLYASLLRCKEPVERAMPAAPLSLPKPPEGDDVLHALEERANALMACVPMGAIEVAGAADVGGELEEENAELLHLKAGLLMILEALPKDALPPPFDATAWREEVKAGTSPLDLRQALGKLEEGLSGDYLSPGFHRRPLLVKGAWLPIGCEVASALPGSTAADLLLPNAAGGASGAAAAAAAAATGLPLAGPASEAEGAAQQLLLAWLPPTSAAVGLRLMSLDASLFYRGGAAPVRERLEVYKFIQRPAPPDFGRDTVAGLPISTGGRVRPTLFPPFPSRLLLGPRVEFSFPQAQFQKDWVTGSSATVAAPKLKGVGKGRGVRAPTAGGRGAGRPSGGGAARGGGRAGASAARASSRAANSGGTGKNKSALAKEFDNSDSERHYGSGLDDDDDEEFVSAPPAVYASHTASGAPSEAAADDRDEDISDMDEGGQQLGGGEGDSDADISLG